MLNARSVNTSLRLKPSKTPLNHKSLMPYTGKFPEFPFIPWAWPPEKTSCELLHSGVDALEPSCLWWLVSSPREGGTGTQGLLGFGCTSPSPAESRPQEPI